MPEYIKKALSRRNRPPYDENTDNRDTANHAFSNACIRLLAALHWRMPFATPWIGSPFAESLSGASSPELSSGGTIPDSPLYRITESTAITAGTLQLLSIQYGPPVIIVNFCLSPFSRNHTEGKTCILSYRRTKKTATQKCGGFSS
ncbi:hypothetical protein [Paenibacillus nasutitermitis]|uniref:hypothetical protein n=1 Tax=Paenibacillus nasutitermitis TaxID=1652958 RepID=UPI0016665FC8|nr:hypothetical protein [Paenibacillus nasutitermitis]